MAEDLQYSSRLDNKRKFDDQGGATSPSPATSSSGRRSTGFSAPTISPTSAVAALSSYNNVPPPPDGIELAKKRAQEIAARLFSVAEAKRPKIESDGGVDDSSNKGFSSALQHEGTNSTSSLSYSGSSKKIEIPNGRVGVIIGRSGETIKYLQVQSGARIQITRDIDADPNSQTRPVELIGTPEQIGKAEQLINEVISEADTGGAGIISARKISAVPGNSAHFEMKVPNNKVGLIIGKGGENIKNMQTTCGARIQVIPLHLPPGDPSTERTVHIDGTKEQIELAKQLVNDVISSENRARNPQTGGYRPPRPPTSWVPPQPNYGYMQPGAYPGPAPQYSMSQPPYAGYPPPPQQTTQVTGYDYYSQQQPPQQPQPPSVVGSSVPSDGNNYNYNQMLTTYNGQGPYGESSFSQSAVGYPQTYGQAIDYNQAGSQAGFAQPIPQAGYTQQSYSSTPAYGNAAPTTQEGANPSHGVESSAQQAPPVQQPSAAAQPGYIATPTSQPGYANQPSVQVNYSQSVPSAAQPPLGQKPQPSQAYVQSTQAAAPAVQAGYVQPAQAYGQGYSQPPPAAPSGFAQDSQQLAPGYVSGALPTGYGQQQSYGGGAYSQQQTQLYGDAYSSSAYSQPPYSADTRAQTSAEPAATSGATKASHLS